MAALPFAPEAKLVGAVALAAASVAVPARSWPALLVVAAVVVALLVRARVTPRWVAGRLLVVAPFLLAALLLPLVATGERVSWGPVSVSESGLESAALLVARSLACVGVALALAATTPVADLTDGLARLRVPAALVLVVSLMVRYLAVVGDDVRRMGVARASRGEGRGLVGRWVAAASGVGRLFVRSYERGERVHLAMVSRGYDGTPPVVTASAPRWHWVAALAPALLVGLLAWGLDR